MSLAKFSLAILVSALLGTGGTAIAQSAKKSVAVRVHDDTRTLIAVRKIERALKELDHLMVYSIVATAGGWSVLEPDQGANAPNADVLRSRTEELHLFAAAANRDLHQNDFANDERRAGGDIVMAHMDTCVEAAFGIADALDDGDATAAGLIYRDGCQSQFFAALRESHAEILTLERALLGNTFRLRVANQ